jgi:hypothetical protein
MAVIVLTGPGGSPGVTTTALALTLTWPRQVVMAECDPAGGTVLPGLWHGQASADSAGLLRYALAAQRDPAAAAARILDDALPIEPPPAQRFVLAASPDPLTGRQIAATWPTLSASLAAAGPDIIADAGRFDGEWAMAPLLAAASLVLMVCRPGVRAAAAAKPRLAALARAHAADGLILIGAGAYGAEASRAMTRALGVPVTAILPEDGATAAVLSDGASPRRGFPRSSLMRAAGNLAGSLASRIASPAAQPAGVPQ